MQKNESLGLIPAERLKDFEKLNKRISVLEDNASNGLAILQNYMGCLINKDTLHFYVYKKMHLLRAKDRINFSIHMNSAENGFDGILSTEYVKAKAYIRYKKRDSTKFSDFYECKISERSYGTEYLYCYINFRDDQNILLPIEKDDELDILYTYQVDQKLYGREIGRKSSVFFEDLIVELGYLPGSRIEFYCVEENDGNYIRVDGKDYNHIEEGKSIVLEKCKNIDLFEGLSIDKFIFKTIYLNSKKINNGFESTVHYYVKW